MHTRLRTCITRRVSQRTVYAWNGHILILKKRRHEFEINQAMIIIYVTFPSLYNVHVYCPAGVNSLTQTQNSLCMEWTYFDFKKEKTLI